MIQRLAEVRPNHCTVLSVKDLFQQQQIEQQKQKQAQNNNNNLGIQWEQEFSYTIYFVINIINTFAR